MRVMGLRSEASSRSGPLSSPAQRGRTGEPSAPASSLLLVLSTATQGGHPQRLQLPVQGGALHADEGGGAADVAAEAEDLGGQVLPLEHLAGIAERERDDPLRPDRARRPRRRDL